MNQGIFKLVFSQALNMFVPVSEIAKSRTCKSAGRKARKMSQSAHAGLLGAVTLVSAFTAYADGPAGIIPQNAAQWIGANIANITANSFTVQQTAAKAYLDFAKFNLLKGETYQQLMGKTDSALLRIHDIDPSSINGNVKAAGQLFMINTNGIIFGKDSQINVGSLYAGSLDITDALFAAGVTSLPNAPAFSGTGGFVLVEQGAQLYSDTGGRVILMAPTVTNNGLIVTPEGQTILAAGNKVYLQALTTKQTNPAESGSSGGGDFLGEDPAHLLVEVSAGGTALNLGKIIADRGNVTMVGLAVNQEGTISASTSVRAGGSVKLLARDVRDQTTTDAASPNAVHLDAKIKNLGKVTVAKNRETGENSLTEVAAVLNDTEEIANGQTSFTNSKIIVAGGDIEIDNSIIVAHGGNISIDSKAQAADPLDTTSVASGGRTYLGKNAVVDVSGLDANAPMSRNQLEIQLYSDQLKDVPLLRGSDIFKKTVYVDARKGTKLTDLAPFVALKTKTVAEKLTNAGTVAIGGKEVITRDGSVINVSGGTTTFAAGGLKETIMTYNGKVIPISEIDPKNTIPTIADVYTDTYSKAKWGVTRYWNLNSGSNANWGSPEAPSNGAQISELGSLVPSYKVGNDAGNIIVNDGKQVLGGAVVLDGTMLANTYLGTEQRSFQTAALGGSVNLTADFSAVRDVLADTFTFNDVISQTGLRKMNTDFLKNGFNRLTLAGEINTPLNVNPNGAVTVAGYQTQVGGTTQNTASQINQNIIAPGSKITITGTNIGNNVTISSAGVFNNDSLAGVNQPANTAASNAIATIAGSISFTGNTVAQSTQAQLGENTLFDASAGAWLDTKNKLNAGKASNISVTVYDELKTSNRLRAYGFNTGGSLTVTAGQNPDTNALAQDQFKNVQIGGTPKAGYFNLAADLFSTGGFSSYAINSPIVSGEFNIGDGSALDIVSQASTWRLNDNYKGLASGSSMVAVASPVLVPDYLRKGNSLKFNLSTAGQSTAVMNLAENTSIKTDAGGKVTLNGNYDVNVLGNITAPAGEILIIGSNDTSGGQVYIGEKSTLNAAGVYRQLPTSGLIKGEILNAGKITIASADGAVITKDGSLLNVKAAQGANDTKFATTVVRETLFGDAGSIDLKAQKAVFIDGDLVANALGTGRGGDLTLTVPAKSNGSNISPPQVFKITQQKTLVASNVVKGSALPSGTQSQISADVLKQAGFDNVSILNQRDGQPANGDDRILLDAGVNLVVPGRLVLQTPLLEVTGNGGAQIKASQLALGSTEIGSASGVAVKGAGDLVLNADQITVTGEVATSNINRTILNAKYDITGGASQGIGSITAPNILEVKARQIYPYTGNTFTLEATGVDSNVSISQSDIANTPVLSAAGTLNVKAEHIAQSGSLKAPFGAINIEATKTLTLAANSVTSVSAEGQLIPFGTADLGGKTYNLNNYVANSGIKQLPEKKINLKSPDIDLQTDAKLDLSGGGDMFAYQFIKGIGGSTDILAQPNYYAVIPSLANTYAPTDAVYQASSTAVKVGDAVHLTGIDGLATGTYTLLPARYALVPGAFLVQAGLSSKLLPNQTAKLIDGSTLTTGYRETLGTGKRDANWSTFGVVSGAILRPEKGAISKSPSEYVIVNANDYFGQAKNNIGQIARLPQDAGHLTINASNSLNLNADLLASKSADARGAIVDISSNNIRLVANKDAVTGALQIKASDLNKLNAESILLGGTRDTANGVTAITTAANSVSIENNADNTLKVSEFIATAKDTVIVKSGAAINSGNVTKTSNSLALNTVGDGALLAVSSVNDITYTRTGFSNTPAQGTLNIEAGAIINAGKSLVLDATNNAALKGTVKVADGGSATVGANRILLGNPSPAIVGLNISNQTLADLGALSKFTANSYKNVDIYGPVNFGNQNLDLTLNSAGVVGHTATGETANITARNLTIKNGVNGTYEAASAATGSTLNITAANVKLEGKATNETGANTGNTQLGGFANLNINTNELRTSKLGKTTLNIAQTNINAGNITADTAADFTLSSIGNVTTAALVSPIASTSNVVSEEGRGAKLSIDAANLTVGNNIALTSGTVTLTSTNDLNLLVGANVSAKSSNKTFYDQQKASPAGTVNLVSKTGNVNVNAGSVVDVSSVNGANAGTVNMNATNASGNGTANITGQLKGTATADATGNTGQGGRLLVDVDKLSDVTATNKNAQDFNESRQYRLRKEASVAITGTGADAIKAKEVIIVADSGAINVTGTLDASGAKDGRISLMAKNDVVLESTAQLLAKSSQAGAQGGTVEINTLEGNLDLKTGSALDVSSGAGGAGGLVYLRAKRNAANTDINISHADSTFTGAQKVQAEGFKDYQRTSTQTSLATADFSKTTATGFYKEAENFEKSVLANNGVGVRRLNKLNDSVFTIVPGIQITGATDLTLANDLTLNDWRFDPTTGVGNTNATQLATGLNAANQPLLAGVLTLRATGNININNNLSDGFTSVNLSTGVLSGLNAWSYNLVAGAEATASNTYSANALATVASPINTSGNATTGNLTVASSKGIRTGTGNINIATGGDLKMGDASSVIYVAGRKADVLDGFDVPPATAGVAFNPSYLSNGGEINIQVKNNIAGIESTQIINDWLYRRGGGVNNYDTSWWVRPELFKQGVASFGGGDVRVSAGNNITNFSVALPTTARYDTNGDPTHFRVDGGGDLTIKAGGDIASGIYFVAKGEGNINSAASIRKAGTASNALGTILALQDGSFNVSANKDAYIETTFNPTLYVQNKANSGNTSNDGSGNGAFFNTYGSQSHVNIESVAGNATLFGAVNNNSSNISSKFTSNFTTPATYLRSLTLLPGNVNLTAFNGDATVGKATLLPSATGQLNVLADKNINLGNLTVSDADQNLLPTPINPASNLAAQIIGFYNNLLGHAATPVHANDAQSINIVANTGSIGLSNLSDSTATLDLAKSAKIVAGTDIKLNIVNVQNVKASDLTLFKAGNDIIGSSLQANGMTIRGPGEALFEAGRHIDLGISKGILANANADNPALAKTSANLSLMAGLGKQALNTDAYIAQYINPTGAGPSSTQSKDFSLAEYRASTTKALTEFIRKNTANESFNVGLSDDIAYNAFNALSAESKIIFVNHHLSSELLAAGKAAAKTNNYDRGYNAVAVLFPNKDYVGDITLLNSKISTTGNSSIDLLAPGGLINVGAPGGSSKTDVGIVTEQGGAIRAFADSGFEVNQSKVITQFGSDITVWVSNGDIDAGRGSKTATATPQRLVSTSKDGITTVDVRGVAVGSGIRAQTYDPDGINGPLIAPNKGAVALLAPRGTLNAGEAGIEAGDILVGALQVIGADNISVSGASQGVPAAAAAGVSGASAGLSPDATNSATQDVARSVAQAASQPIIKPSLPSLISVEVLGIGQ